MSVFPKHVPPGGNVVLHVRFPGPRDAKPAEIRRPLFPALGAAVRPPGGEFQQLTQWRTCYYPRPPASGPEAWDEELATGFRKRAPLLLIANRLQGAKRSQRELVSLLDGIRSSTHFYHVIRIPDEAPLGRYETVVETFLHGRQHRKHNSFSVERLEIEAVEPKAGGLSARVLNPSPEATKAVLVELPADSDAVAGSTPLIVPPQQTLALATRESKAILFYADDTCWIPLAADGDRYCLRDQALPWLESANGSEVHLFPGGDPDEAYSLAGEARQVWLAADGLHLKSEIRNSRTADAYDLMVERELIHELPGNRPVHAEAASVTPGRGRRDGP